LGGAGSQFWNLTSIQDDDSLYPDYDGFRVLKESREAGIIREHSKRMNGKN
ncbi:glycoside hydrolase, partial [Bacillus sp. PsM16]|nr:glycoside hydrolase [Bacillus sp. PsM16]